MRIWDYQLTKNWQPKTDTEWQWYLVRRINYGDLKGLKKEKIEKLFPKIRDFLDPGKREMLAYFLKNG